MDKWKSTVAHVVTALVGVYTTVSTIMSQDFGHSVPAGVAKIAGIVLTVLSALGLYENTTKNP